MRSGVKSVCMQELHEVVKSIYMLLGSHTEQEFSDRTIEQHANRIFDKFDRDHDDVITADDFFDICKNVRYLNDE